MKKKKKRFCYGSHTFHAWTEKSGGKPVRRCQECDYEQTRKEFFSERKEELKTLVPKLEIAKRSEHIDLFI